MKEINGQHFTVCHCKLCGHRQDPRWKGGHPHLGCTCNTGLCLCPSPVSLSEPLHLPYPPNPCVPLWPKTEGGLNVQLCHPISGQAPTQRPGTSQSCRSRDIVSAWIYSQYLPVPCLVPPSPPLSRPCSCLQQVALPGSLGEFIWDWRVHGQG